MIFKEELFQEEIEVQDKKGKIHKIKIKYPTLKELAIIEALMKDENKTNGDIIKTSLKIYFDTDVKFWEQFSVKWLTKFIREVQGQNNEVKKKD